MLSKRNRRIQIKDMKSKVKDRTKGYLKALMLTRSQVKSRTKRRHARNLTRSQTLACLQAKPAKEPAFPGSVDWKNLKECTKWITDDVYYTVPAANDVEMRLNAKEVSTQTHL